MTESVLLVEDDTQLAGLISEYLQEQQFEVLIECDGNRALERIRDEQPSVVILDLMLPGKDGISICREARFHYQGPILMLTASSDAVDQILGLEIGADDYIHKPVEPRILLARIRAALRRSDTATDVDHGTSRNTAEILRFGELKINKSARQVFFAERALELTTPEYDVMLFLAENPGQTITRDELFQAVRKLEYDGQNRFIDITISQIRKKLGTEADNYLKTVRGQGYLFMLHDQ